MPSPPDLSIYSGIQGAINNTIKRPNFNAALPPLSDATWMKLLEKSPHALAVNDRLEFMGDALMYATIGHQLVIQIPDGTPHMYTDVRAALHSNATFSLLAEKLDILAVSSPVLRALTERTFGEGNGVPVKTRPQVKSTADLFEAIIACYYFESGYEALCEWVKELYTPLMTVAREAFYDGQRIKRQRRIAHHNSSAGPAAKRPYTMDYRPLQRIQSPPRHSMRLRDRIPERRHYTPQRRIAPLPRARSVVRQELRPAADHGVALQASSQGTSSNISTSSQPVNPAAVRNLVKQWRVSCLKAASQPNPYPTTSKRFSPRLSKRKAPIFIDLTLDSDSDSDSEDFQEGSSGDTSLEYTVKAITCPVAQDDEDTSDGADDAEVLKQIFALEDHNSDMDIDSEYLGSDDYADMDLETAMGSPVKLSLAI